MKAESGIGGVAAAGNANAGYAQYPASYPTVIGVGVKFDYQKKFSIDMGYTTFANSTKYDPFRDRDYYSLSFSTTF